MLLKVAYEQAKAAKYILCRTTFDDKSMLIEPDVTALALKWLVGQWPQWRANYKLHTLIICIPYGGKYKREEEDAVSDAHSSGIIIVSMSSRMEGNWNSHMEKSTDTKVAVCKFLDFIPRYVP